MSVLSVRYGHVFPVLGWSRKRGLTVYRLVGNAEDAQDVVQDAFLNAYQSLGSFKGDSLFFTWLYRIAINTAISHKRKQRSQSKPCRKRRSR